MNTKKEKCLPCLVHQLQDVRLFIMSFSSRGSPISHLLLVGKDRIDALSKAFNKEEYDEYVEEMQFNRDTDPDTDKTQTWEEWLEGKIDGDERELVEVEDDMILK